MRVLTCLLLLEAASAEPSFQVVFDVTLSKGVKGSFTVEVYPDWAPLGAARFKDVVDGGIWKAARFFRVVSGFMVQWGIPGKPKCGGRVEREEDQGRRGRQEQRARNSYVCYFR